VFSLMTSFTKCP